MVIATGGNMWLGRTLCDELARLGATVVVADIKGERMTRAGGMRTLFGLTFRSGKTLRT
jgi:NAD(P)-dependent dehydrogenase (short-subunit alcohol dehydrogenase family)